MDIYLLDSSYLPSDILEEYVSFIWTEKYQDKLDFELVIQPTVTNLKKLIPGAAISHTETYNRSNSAIEIGLIKTVEKYYDDDGRYLLKVTGSGLSTMLEDRLDVPGTTNVYPAANVILNRISYVCTAGSGWGGFADVIAGMVYANQVSSAGATDVSVSKLETVYAATKRLCQASDYGFKIVWNNTSNQYTCIVYDGTLREQVIFSTGGDTLAGVSTLDSISGFKNIAYVAKTQSPGYQIVPASGVSASIQGVNRRVLAVDATDIDPATMSAANYNTAIIRRGRDALGEAARIAIVDGQAVPNSQYVYGTDYKLGDLVYMSDGMSSPKLKRVTEQILSADANGILRYPTLTDKVVV